MSADKRSVHTDALATLGNIIGPGEKRDAIHLAVEPVIAAEPLLPGMHVGFIDGGVGRSTDPVGIVDPFIQGIIQKGQMFWLVVYPRTITSLRHVWDHPKFPETSDSSDQEQVSPDPGMYLKDVAAVFFDRHKQQNGVFEPPMKRYEALEASAPVAELHLTTLKEVQLRASTSIDVDSYINFIEYAHGINIKIGDLFKRMKGYLDSRKSGENSSPVFAPHEFGEPMPLVHWDQFLIAFPMRKQDVVEYAGDEETFLKYKEAVDFIQSVANDISKGYDEVMEAADDWLNSKKNGSWGEYLTGGHEMESAFTPPEFWTHYEVITGKTVEPDHRGNFFSCSCS